MTAFDKPIALKLFDVAVNMGGGTAAKFLQRVLNVLNRRQADYPDMTVDGAIGPKTVSAFTAFMTKRTADGEMAVSRRSPACRARDTSSWPRTGSRTRHSSSAGS
ncbi:putative peptidoglycan-binding domain-containing protein [Streptomyces sp. SID1121]|uniref:putative peptidoglycan-binding domain-containing protein n=1 Tax=Streptomyces sp. SID1121 TaxID=3425888 RepID=UPI0040571071